jgi:hypothetical protein
VLRHDGLAVATFGQPVGSVMAVLAGLLSPPDSEEVQVSAEVDRTVQWDDPFLHLQFTSWDHFGGGAGPDPVPEGPIFHYYLTTSDRFATEASVTAGSTVAQLTAAYPDAEFHTACGGDLPRDFLVDPPAVWPQLPSFGLIDGDVENPETRIAYIGAGWDRSPC